MGDRSFRSLAERHLQLHLRVLNRRLRDAVERQMKESSGLDRPEVAHVAITDRHAQVMVERAEAQAEVSGPVATMHRAGEEEEALASELRAAAAEHGRALPLDELRNRFDLSGDEIGAVVACAAPEVDRAYERLYAFVLDDVRRTAPCVELLAMLHAPRGSGDLVERHRWGRFGAIRRLRVVQPVGNAVTDLRQELCLAPGLFEFLIGSRLDLDVLAGDPSEIEAMPPSTPPLVVDRDRVSRLGRALVDGVLSLLGVWGPDSSERDVMVRAVAEVAGKPLRVFCVSQLPKDDLPATALRDEIQAATSLDAILWVPVGWAAEPEWETVANRLAGVLARSTVPTILSAAVPWRPVGLTSRRAYAEVSVELADYPARREMWAAALPEEPARQLDRMAGLYRMSSSDIGAVAAMVRAARRVWEDADAPERAGDVEAAAAAVAIKRVNRFARSVLPVRKLGDLVLPDEQSRQIRHVAAYFDAWPAVADGWGFRRVSGQAGIKALFTGEPGTGKTLAAEVIAGELGLRLLKVDLGRVVSKWVGETEKNLEAAFSEAEDSRAILFFDEADALFGKRGEVRHGTDRYANLEVGYLLQRLEAHDGLVVLASNLKENMDAAFTRRFHFIVHFPRPELAERRRIWDTCFPETAPIAGDVDRDALAKLDLTGAGIASAAREAALLAAHEKSDEIAMTHVARAVRQQYAREARVLRPHELGEYAHLS